MARDFLAIPLSTVPSESAFSLGGRILGESRSSLTPEMLEALVCVWKRLAVQGKEADNQGRAVICKSFLLFHCLIFFQVKVILTFAWQVKIFVKISQLILLPWSFHQVQPNTLILDEISLHFFGYLHGCSSTNKPLNNIGQSIRYKYIIWRSRSCTHVMF